MRACAMGTYGSVISGVLRAKDLRLKLQVWRDKKVLL